MKRNVVVTFSVTCALVIGLAQLAQGQTSWPFVPAPRGALDGGDTFTTYVVVHNEASDACEVEVWLNDGGGNPSDPESFRFNGAPTTNPFPVSIPSFEVREIEITSSNGFSSGALLVTTDCAPAAANNVTVFGRYEVFRPDPETGNNVPVQTFSPTSGPPLIVPQSGPEPYISAWIDWNGGGDLSPGEDPLRNLGIAWASRVPVPEGTVIDIWINNQNRQTIVGPITRPFDGSFQSQFVDEIPGWPLNTFSEPFQGTVNMSLRVPGQQGRPITVDVQVINVVGSGDQFQFNSVQPIVPNP